MKTITNAFLMMTLLFLTTQAGSSELSPTQEMANIIKHLNHYPSDAEKMSLRNIIKSADASMNEHTIANALINMEHKVNPADKAKLKEVVNNSNATNAEREIAKILLEFHHKPSAANKKQLEKITDHH